MDREFDFFQLSQQQKLNGTCRILQIGAWNMAPTVLGMSIGIWNCIVRNRKIMKSTDE